MKGNCVEIGLKLSKGLWANTLALAPNGEMNETGKFLRGGKLTPKELKLKLTWWKRKAPWEGRGVGNPKKREKGK